MESIIRVIKGADQGTTATLLQGQTVLGRGAKAGLKFTAPSVSWEHALVSRSGDDYYLENLSAHGTWVNDTRVAGKVRLRPRDEIKLADDAVVRFEPAGMPQGLLARRNLLILAMVVVVLCGGILALFNPFAEPAGVKPDWDRTFATLSEFLDKEVKTDRLSPMVQQLFQTGWRLHLAGDEHGAQGQWFRLQFLLDSLEPKYHFNKIAADNPQALHDLCRALPNSPEARPDNDVAAAATVQFVRYYLDWSTKFVQSGG